MSKVPKHIPLPGRDPCWYCMHNAHLIEDSTQIYGKDYGPMWVCEFCGAHVGCHPGTNKALGRLANKELRQLKMAAHKAFDTLWHWKIKHEGCRRKSARGKAYAWLAKELGVPTEECHIGYFTPDQCRLVIEICQPIKDKLKWRDAA